MAYVPIPKDLSNVKTKLMFNLTQRQIICFSIAIAVGLPPFFLTKDTIGTSNAVLLMMVLMFPMFMFAMYEKHNQPLEVILKNYISVKFCTSKHRPYMTNNFYSVLERQEQLDKEVNYIVKHSKNKTKQSRKTRNPKSNTASKKQS